MNGFLVVGDVMLDETLHVSVKGLAPECATSLCVREEQKEYGPGGAASVAVNLHNLLAERDKYTDSKVILFGNTGEDTSSLFLEKTISQNTDLYGNFEMFLEKSEDNVTTKRFRVFADKQLLLRIDTDPPTDCDIDKPFDREIFHCSLKQYFPNTLVCLVNHDKGTFSRKVRKRLFGPESFGLTKLYLVDPGSGGDWSLFSSEKTVFKANIYQALAQYRFCLTTYRDRGFHDPLVSSSCSSVEELQKTGNQDNFLPVLEAIRYNLKQSLVTFRFVVITFGEGGIGLIDRDGNTFWTKGDEVTVVNSCGAGDIVMAALACGLMFNEDQRFSTMQQHCINADRLARYAVQHPSICPVGFFDAPRDVLRGLFNREKLAYDEELACDDTDVSADDL